jgi:capsular exopolysaccharide synthesis family protein
LLVQRRLHCVYPRSRRCSVVCGVILSHRSWERRSIQLEETGLVAEERKAMNLESTLAVLRARIVLIVLCFVLVAGSAFAFSKLQTKEYTATAKLLFRDPGLDQQAAGVPATGSRDPQRETATNVNLVKLGSVAERTAEKLGHGLSPASVLSSVTVGAEGATDIAAVAATTNNPRQAAALANTFTEEFIATRREIDQAQVLGARRLVERQLTELTPRERDGIRGQSLVDRSESLRILASLQTGNAELVERAVAPASPSSPKVARNTVLGGVFGLILGIGLAFLLARLDRRIRKPEDLARAFGLPLLGVVPESDAYAATAGGDGATALPPREAEAFRMLRAHLRYFNIDRDVRTVLVSSATSGEGKSTVARHLALAAASMGTRVLLIEADLRRPSLAERLGQTRDTGLGEVLIGALPVAEAIRSVHVPSGMNGAAASVELDVLLVGAIPPNPAELIESRAMEELLAWASEHYELVLIDTPPLTVVSDAIPLLRRVDGVVIVSRLGESTTDAAERMRSRLASLGAPMLGVVGNAYVDRKLDGYGYTYYQGEPSSDLSRSLNGPDEPTRSPDAVGSRRESS